MRSGERGPGTRAALAVVVLALAQAPALAPFATAGSEQQPDVPGVRDRSDETLDFLGAWFQSASDGVLFTVKFAGSDKPPVDHMYLVSFRYNGSFHVAAIGFDPNGTLRTELRPPNFNRPTLVRGPEAFSNVLPGASFRAGHPASVSATIPFSALPSLGPGKVLVDLYAGTATYTRGGGWDDADSNQTQNTYVIERAVLPASAQGARVPLAIGLVIALGVAGGAAGIMIARRRR